MFKTVKNLLKKSDAVGQDWYLALPSYRTTPIDSNLPSPAELLNQRDYRTQLPCSGRLQRSQTMEYNQKQLQHRQDVQKRQYDGKSPRELQKLVPGQEVSVFQLRTKTWVPVEVKEDTTQPRSYVVKTAWWFWAKAQQSTTETIRWKGTNLWRTVGSRTIRTLGPRISPPHLHVWRHPTKFRQWSHYRHPTNQLNSLRKVMVCKWQLGVAVL